MKKFKSKVKQWHTSDSQVGMGDYTGQAIRNPMGRIRDGNGVNPVKYRNVKTPPKSWA